MPKARQGLVPASPAGGDNSDSDTGDAGGAGHSRQEQSPGATLDSKLKAQTPPQSRGNLAPATPAGGDQSSEDEQPAGPSTAKPSVQDKSRDASRLSFSNPETTPQATKLPAAPQQQTLNAPLLPNKDDDDASSSRSSHGTFDEAQAKQPTSERQSSQRKTLFAQPEIVAELSLPVKMLGITLAFITTICIWEAVNFAVEKQHPSPKQQMSAYFVLGCAAGISLYVSHHWSRGATTTLFPSFIYALSTLALAIGVWGMLEATARMLVPSGKSMYGVWLAGSLIFLTLTIIYAAQTKHNALLDIVSCALSLGLFEDMDIDDDEKAHLSQP